MAMLIELMMLHEERAHVCVVLVCVCVGGGGGGGGLLSYHE